MSNSSRILSSAFSRRTALSCGIGFVAATVAVRQAPAKMAPAAATYQGTPKGDQNCSNCSLFQPPKACQLIEGDVSANGWCKYWVKKLG
jgi:hypothetical protein